MSSRSTYISHNHANWETIQIDSFLVWVNQHLQERGLLVKDIQGDFADGVMLLNLLEVLTQKKIPRYVKSPKFLQHKIDNILIALAFMEKNFEIKVQGCNAKDIADGNLKQIMGVIFLLIQKVKVNELANSAAVAVDDANSTMSKSSSTDSLSSVVSTNSTSVANSTSMTNSASATIATSTPSQPRPSVSKAVNTMQRIAKISTTLSKMSASLPTVHEGNNADGTAPQIIKGEDVSVTKTTSQPVVNVSVSSIRSKFTENSNAAVNANPDSATPNATTAASSSNGSSDASHRHTLSGTTRSPLRKTESGGTISMTGSLSLGGSFEKFDPLNRSMSALEIKYNQYETKFYELKSVILVQSRVRGFLARMRWKNALKKYRTKIQDYKEAFAPGTKAYRGLCKIQATMKGRKERKRLYKEIPTFRRNEIVREIISTEKRYVESLHIVIVEYLDECKKMQMNQQTIRNIFSSIDIIYNYNKLMLEELQARYRQSVGNKLADIFTKITSFLKVYTMYVNNYNNSFQAITEARESSKFSELLEKNRAAFGLDLSSFLIMPIQRLPRYVLLLQDLVKHTQESHSDYHDLHLALKKMKEVAEYVNEKKREAENMNQVLMIQNSLTGMKIELAKPHRRYVHKGALFHNDKVYLYYLFNDMLVKTENKSITKLRESTRLSRGTLTIPKDEGKSKLIDSYPLDNVSIRDPHPEKCSFELVNVSCASWASETSPTNHPQTITIIFETLSLDEKLNWMSEIDDCISQLLENQRSKKRPLINESEEINKSPYDGPIEGCEFTGNLQKKHTEILWKQKAFYLKNSVLYYHRLPTPEKEPIKIKSINLILCSVKLVQVVDHHHCFQLVAPSRIYYFECDDSTSLFKWIYHIRQSIKKKLDSLVDNDLPQILTTSSPSVLTTSISNSPLPTSPLSNSSSSIQPSALNLQPDNPLNDPSNKVCAECGAPGPSWVSLAYGVVICLDCSAIHKGLVSNESSIPNNMIKSVRSLSQNVSDLDFLRQNGNSKSNSFYEKHLSISGLQKPGPKDSYELKVAWIKAKYNIHSPQSSTTGFQLSSSTSTTASPNTGSSSPMLERKFSVTLKNDSNPNSPVLTSTLSLSSLGKFAKDIDLNNISNNPEEQKKSEEIINNSPPTSEITTPQSTTTTTTTSTRSETPDPMKIIDDLSSSTPKSTDEILDSLADLPNVPNGRGTWSRGSHATTERKQSYLIGLQVPIPKKDYEGYLYKTSRPDTKDASDWKKYLFIYKDGILRYYKVDKKKKKKEKGSIDISVFGGHGPNVQRLKQKYSFSILTSSRLYFLAAESEEDMNKWFEMLPKCDQIKSQM